MQLVDRRFAGELLSLELLREEALAVQPHAFDHGVGFGEAAADAGVLRGGPSVALRSLRQLDDLRELADQPRDLRDAGALMRQRGHRDSPALSFFAEQVLHGNANVVKEDLREVRTAGHVLDRPHFDAWGIHLHEQARNAFVLVLRAGIGAREQDDPLGVGCARRPDLLTVDHVLIAVAHSLALEGGEVAAGARLRVARAPLVLAVQNVRQELLLLLLGPVFDDRRPHPLESHHGRAERGCACFRHLFFEDDLLHDAPTASAVLGGPVEAYPTLLADALEPVRHQVRVLASLRREVLLDERAHFVAERFLFRRQVEIH